MWNENKMYLYNKNVNESIPTADSDRPICGTAHMLALSYGGCMYILYRIREACSSLTCHKCIKGELRAKVIPAGSPNSPDICIVPKCVTYKISAFSMTC